MKSSKPENVAVAIRPMVYPDDLAAIKRIWREVGWVDEAEAKHLDQFFSVGKTLLATINDSPECSVHIVDGSLRLQDKDLPLCAVTAVTTSRISRGHAFAKRLTALQLQQGHADGAAVAALGMFDQGFYDQLGFGSGGYDHQLAFDPSTLNVNHRVPTPQRIDVEDYQRVHTAMCNRHKVHGSVILHSPELMQTEMNWTTNGFGLGYSDGEGGVEQLTHFLWLSGKGEHGPYTVTTMAYQNTDQLLELLGLLKSLGDQVYSVKMLQPPEIQLQDLLARPFRNRSLTAGSKHEATQRSFAWWQLRILNLPRCVAAYHGHSTPLRFQLEVDDPLETLLDEGSGWRGVGGSYIVVIGPQSHAEQGREPDLPVLTCSVNAFTRLLWGIAKASSLAVTDSFSAPVELLTALDRAVMLPTPHTGWDF